jgi:molybdate transport system substrate-binding protein
MRLFVTLFLLLFSAPAAARPVMVFAAASLKTALDEIAPGYGKAVTASYGASSALAKQIAAGAPADLFISADLDWMDWVAERRLIRPASRVDLLGNRLVLIAAADNPLSLAIAPGFPLARALGQGRLAIADPGAVPAGRYGRAALQRLGVWPELEARAARTENVRAALALVARGEAPLGIVYATDAAAEPKVRVVDRFPEATHPPIVYPAALTIDALPEAADFLAYLRSPEARARFERQGFTVAR